MPKRWRTNNRGTAKYSPSRKERKRRFINVKNRCRSGRLGHQGVYYSYHVHQDPMSWIDVYFPSIKHKGRYFSAALITCEHKAADDDQDATFKAADEAFPDVTIDIVSSLIPRKRPQEMKMYGMQFVTTGDYEGKKQFEKEYQTKLNNTPRMVRPSITIDYDYWYPAIGLHGVVNTPSLTEEVIIEFIEQFRALGEPITDGLVWEGEEVEVVPERLNERYAQSDSDRSETDLD